MKLKPPLPTTTLENSRRLRRKMTDAERRLWGLIRAGQLDGLKFRRQHPIPPYIVDFCCVEKNLVIELDGSQHNAQSDLPRIRALASRGWRMIRFWDNDVLLATEAVVEAVWNAACGPYPHPNPSPDVKGALSKASA